MALVTVHRSPTPSIHSEDSVEDGCDDHGAFKSPNLCHGASETYLTVRGAALILSSSCFLPPLIDCPESDGSRDICRHLKSMYDMLRTNDTIKLTVRLETTQQLEGCWRYMTLISTEGIEGSEESAILGIDITNSTATIGLVLPVWNDLSIHLDGDGGFCLTTNDRHHVFKPVSVQAMWSALQSIINVRDAAHAKNYYVNGLSHSWICYYTSHINSSLAAINEWHQMQDIESRRPAELTDSDCAQLQRLMRNKLKDIMMSVDLEEVTSKYLRQQLEEELKMSLLEYKHFIDEEMITIMRQMDSPSKIFDYLYLGSEWNASNMDELKLLGVGYILNVTREIDNFFPGVFEYYNVRVHDIEDADLLKHWHKTYEFITQARSNNSKVLVHCKMGISRSASTVIAYVMKECNWSLEEAYQYVKEQRNCVRPNNGFMQQLRTYEGILDASKRRHSVLWRSPSSAGQDNEMLTFLCNEECDPDNGGFEMDDMPSEVQRVDSVDSEHRQLTPVLDGSQQTDCNEVQLISVVHHDWTVDDELGNNLASSVDWSDDDDDTSSSCEHGFYDMTAQSTSVDSEHVESETCVHQNVKLEPLVTTEPQIHVTDALPKIQQHLAVKNSSAYSESLRVRRDDFWIKETTGANDELSCDNLEPAHRNVDALSPVTGESNQDCPPNSASEIEVNCLETDNVDEIVDLSTDVSLSKVGLTNSVYKTEDLNLEPGLVQRTKEEFEKKERSSSLIDITASLLSPPLRQSSPMQRSSSFRTPRLRPSDKKWTYCSLFGKYENVRQNESSSDPLPSVIISCNNEIQEGLVKRTLQDFEVKNGDSAESNGLSSVADEYCKEIPVETGSVRRHRVEIEKKCGVRDVNSCYAAGDESGIDDCTVPFQRSFSCRETNRDKALRTHTTSDSFNSQCGLRTHTRSDSFNSQCVGDLTVCQSSVTNHNCSPSINCTCKQNSDILGHTVESNPVIDLQTNIGDTRLEGDVTRAVDDQSLLITSQVSDNFVLQEKEAVCQREEDCYQTSLSHCLSTSNNIVPKIKKLYGKTHPLSILSLESYCLSSDANITK